MSGDPIIAALIAQNMVTLLSSGMDQMDQATVRKTPARKHRERKIANERNAMITSMAGDLPSRRKKIPLLSNFASRR